MSISEAFGLVANNLNSTTEILIVAIAFLAGLVFYASDFRLGSLLHFLVYGVIFVWFYEKNMAWAYPLILMLIGLVVLTFTLMATQKAADKGGII